MQVEPYAVEPQLASLDTPPTDQATLPPTRRGLSKRLVAAACLLFPWLLALLLATRRVALFLSEGQCQLSHWLLSRRCRDHGGDGKA